MAFNYQDTRARVIDKATHLWEDNNRGLRTTSKVKAIGWALFRSILLIGVCFIIIYPILTMLSFSFRTQADLTDPSIVWIPKELTFTPIKDAFTALDYPNSLWNTIKICMVSSLLQVATCALAGYGFARFKFRFKGPLFALVIFTIMVPPQVVYTPTYLSYRHFNFFGIGSLIEWISGTQVSANILDTMFVMWLPALLGVGIRSGLFIYIYRQFYRGLPKELEDAAYIDGCGFAQTFLRVIIPNSKSSFLTVFLISTVWYWNDYYYTTMYFTNTATLSSALAEISRRLRGVAGVGDLMLDAYASSSRVQAACLLVIIPVLVMYIFLQKHFTEGLERSGIVG